MVYKWCVVPQCTNTSIKTPEKLFVTLPKDPKLRKKWLTLAHRNPNDIMAKSCVFCCEDHFDMEKDMANYTQYKMGFSQKILMKDGTLPWKFDCQEDHRRKKGDATTSQTAFKKIQKSDENVTKTSVLNCNNVMQKANALKTKGKPRMFCQGTQTKFIVTAEKCVQVELKGNTRTVIAKVYHFLEREYLALKEKFEDLDLSPLLKFRARTAEATGVSEKTVSEILKEEQELKKVPPQVKRAGKRKRDQDVPHDIDRMQAEPGILTVDVKVETLDDEDYKEQADPDSDTLAVHTEPADDHTYNPKQNFLVIDAGKIIMRPEVNEQPEENTFHESEVEASQDIKIEFTEEGFS